MEVEIDRDLSTIIARRQPTARDLRLLDRHLQDHRQPRACRRRSSPRGPHGAAPDRGRWLHAAARAMTDLPRGRPRHGAVAQGAGRLCPAGRRARRRGARHDDQIDKEFDGLLRKLITYMMEDPRTSRRPSTSCSWPRPSSAWVTTRRTWPRWSSTWSRARTCATTPRPSK